MRKKFHPWHRVCLLSAVSAALFGAWNSGAETKSNTYPQGENMNIFQSFGIEPGKVKGVGSVVCLEQGWGTLAFHKDIIGGDGVPCGDKVYPTGFGTHAPSRIRIALQKKAKSFHAVCGSLMDKDIVARQTTSDMEYIVEANGKVLYTTGLLKFKEVRTVDVALPDDIQFLDLVVAQGYANAHAAWADTRIEFADGTVEDPSEPPRQVAFPYSCPVTFEYDGKSSAELFQANPPVATSETTDKGEVVTVLWNGGTLRMKSVVTLYKDFPVAEWHTEFDNPSAKRSAQLKNVRVVNADVLAPRQLRRRHGSCHDLRYGGWGKDAFQDSYQPVIASMDESEWSFGATGGRPTDNWLPCFDLEGEKDDLRFVIGWAGQWSAHIKNDMSVCHVAAGMEELDTYLDPGETITQPSVFMLYTPNGKEADAANLWRRFVLQHVMLDSPKDAPFAHGHWGGMGEEMHMARLDDVEKHQMRFDVYWIDAGWFAEKSPSEFSPVWANNVGDWKFDKDSYPDELKNISKRLHQNGRKLLLWFEPERVIKDRDIAKAHPEYLIFNESNQALLDLGNPEAWQWCRNTIGKIIEENGIDWYREDFNFEPLEYWRSKDAPNRKGMTEVRFVEGLYRFWKSLRDSYPNLKIDNCSSGGRRLDIELIRYSIPLWYSDMQCFPDFDPDYSLVQSEGLAHYLPVFGGGIANHEGGDTYNFRANYNPALTAHYFYSVNQPVSDEYPREWLKKMTAEYYSIRDVFAGDFYTLVEPERIKKCGTWTVLQYVRHDAAKSVILAFHPMESAVLKYQITPRGLEEVAQYRVCDMDGLLAERTLSGRELMAQGLELELKERRSSAVIVLEKVTAK